LVSERGRVPSPVAALIRWLSCGANHGHWHNLSRSFGVFFSGSLGRGVVMVAVAAVAVSGSDAVWRWPASSQSLSFAQACSGEQIPLLTGAAPPDPGRENRGFLRRWSVWHCVFLWCSTMVRVLCGVLPESHFLFSQITARDIGVVDQALLQCLFLFSACSPSPVSCLSAFCKLWPMWALLI
jgi:hypothetical protein